MTPTHLTQKQQKPHSPPAEADGVRPVTLSALHTQTACCRLEAVLVLVFLIGSFIKKGSAVSIAYSPIPHCSVPSTASFPHDIADTVEACIH